MVKVDTYEYPLDAEAIRSFAGARGLSPARIKRELRTLHCRRDEVARACRTNAVYSWEWVDRIMQSYLRLHIPELGCTVEELYWRIRVSGQPMYTRWVTLSDITQMAKKHGCTCSDGRLMPVKKTQTAGSSGDNVDASTDAGGK